LADTQAVRCLVGFWWFFCLAVTAIYTGNLIAVLAVPKSSLPIETLEDLADQDFYKYGTIDGAALSSLMAVSTPEYPVHQCNTIV
jgi:hypothetical protein